MPLFYYSYQWYRLHLSKLAHICHVQMLKGSFLKYLGMIGQHFQVL